MSVFGSILNKIFHREPKASAPAAPPKPAAPAPQPAAAAQPAASATPPPTQTAQPAQPVDVEAVLTELAASKGGGGNWRTSIVDLLKLLDLDSSLEARKSLAEELGVHAGAPGSAEQNIALSKAVWTALAKNGGKLPASLTD